VVPPRNLDVHGFTLALRDHAAGSAPRLPADLPHYGGT
jgi:hypothetical protein